MLKESTTTLYGNDRYEGYAIDLVDELSRRMGFTYTILIQEDRNYGEKKSDGTWDGLIGEIHNHVTICILFYPNFSFNSMHSF